MSTTTTTAAVTLDPTVTPNVRDRVCHPARSAALHSGYARPRPSVRVCTTAPKGSAGVYKCRTPSPK